MTEPLLGRLHRRGETLTVGALPWVAPIYRAMPQVHAVIELPFAHGGLQWAARRAMARQLRGRFAKAYVLPNSIKSALLPWWAGIPQRVGYHGESRLGLLTQRLANPKGTQRPPMVMFYSALSAEQGLEADQPRLQLSEAKRREALDFLQVQPEAFYVFAPGAEFGPAKRWPPAHFAALAADLTLPVLLLGSAKEMALCAEITERVNQQRPGHCISWAGRTSLDQAIAAIASAKAMVSNDSGLMHVAAAFGTTQIALFGSSSPLHTPPLNAAATVVWLRDDPAYRPALDCAPCYARTCPLGHTRCLVDITPERVSALIEKPKSKV